MDYKTKFNYFNQLLCTVFTILLVTKCLYLYLLDDDTTQVEYHQFHEDDGTIYPSITFCFEWPIDLKESLWEQFLDS